MANKSTAETVVLRLQDAVSAPADAALGALGRLEAQIVREQGALSRLEENLKRAKAGLSALAEGAPDARAVAAFAKQGEAVRGLEAALTEAKDTLAIMAQTRVEPKVFAGAQSAVEALTGKLEAARAKMDALKPSGAVDLGAYRKQKDAVAALSDKLGSQKDKLAGLAEKMASAGEKSASLKAKLASTNKVIHTIAGESGAGASKVLALSKAFASVGPHAAIAAIGIGLTIVALAGLVSAFALAINSADHLRNELLDLRVAGVFWWDGQRANTAAALALQGQIDNLAGSTAVARDKLVDYATQLKNSYFRGGQLKSALEGMAIAGAAGGDKLASTFLGLAQNARFFGQDLDKLTERFKKKFGAVAEARLLSLGVQFAKFKENIAFIFSGADIEPFLRGLQAILGLFNRNTDSAKAMRSTVTKLTEAAIGGFLRLGIWLVKAYIAVRTNQVAWKALGFIFDGIVTGIKTIAIVSAALFALFGASVAVGVGLWGAMWGAISKVVGILGQFFQWLDVVDLADRGVQMIKGLAEGIKRGAGAVWEAMKGAVSSAIDKTIAFLRIHSPSGLVADRIGEPTILGIPAGAERAKPEVDARMAKAAGGAVDAMGGGSVSNTSTSSAGPSLTFTNCTFGGNLSQADVDRMMRTSLEKASLDATPSKAA